MGLAGQVSLQSSQFGSSCCDFSKPGCGYNVICVRLCGDLCGQQVHSVVFKELLDMITCAVAELRLDWLDENFSIVHSKQTLPNFTPCFFSMQISPIFPGVKVVE